MESPTGVLSNPGMLCPVTNEPLQDDPAGVYVLKEDLERIQLGLHNRPVSVRFMPGFKKWEI